MPRCWHVYLQRAPSFKETNRHWSIPGNLMSHVAVAGRSLGLSREKSRYCRATGIGWLHSQAVHR